MRSGCFDSYQLDRFHADDYFSDLLQSDSDHSSRSLSAHLHEYLNRSESFLIYADVQMFSHGLEFDLHHRVLYDLRTVLGSDHAQYFEIGTRRGTTLGLVLQHRYNTSILAVCQEDAEHELIQSVLNQLNSHGSEVEILHKDEHLFTELHNREFMADIVFLDDGHDMDILAKVFYNIQDFVKPGGFLVFDDYDCQKECAGDVPAFVDELVSKIEIHGWEYWDVWGSFPSQESAGGKVFIFRRSADPHTPNPLVSAFSSKFFGRRRELDMGLSRARLPDAAPRAGNAVHFAVVMSFFKRDFDPLFIIPQVTSLESLARQTYPGWTLVAVADGLAPADTAALRRAIALAGIPPGRVRLSGIDARFREERIYRNRDPKFDWDFGAPQAGAPLAPPPPRLGVWKCAGTNALNAALDEAARVPAATHVARLDEDDVWLPDHLANLVSGYSWALPHLGRPADFVYTQGRDIGGQRYFPSFNRSTCGLAQASAAARLARLRRNGGLPPLRRPPRRAPLPGPLLSHAAIAECPAPHSPPPPAAQRRGAGQPLPQRADPPSARCAAAGPPLTARCARGRRPEFAPPYACHLIHATASWDVRRLDLRYRLLGEQLAFPTAGCGTCDYDCDGRLGAGQAVDADMWARVEGLMERGAAAAVLQPTCDVAYTNQSKKAALKAALAAAPHPDAARAALRDLV